MKNPLYLSKEKDIATYIPSKELVDVFELAQSLSRPLLLSGKPGTGKTQFAHWLTSGYLPDQFQSGIVKEAFLSKPLIFNTKSTSIHTDLFYTYDAVSHFRNKDEKKSTDHFIELNALGIAILIAKEFKNVPPVYENIVKRTQVSMLQRGVEKASGSVVLIDEVDKAPRDFPNDLLFEIENMSFAIKELSMDPIQLSDEEKQRVVVILTSNSEKNLPDAFLRRCAYYHIEFPDKKALGNIVLSKLMARSGDRNITTDLAYLQQMDKLLDYFFALHKAPEVMKKPSTSECIEWIVFLDRRGLLTVDFQSADFKTSLSALVKNAQDRQSALAVLQNFKS